MNVRRVLMRPRNAGLIEHRGTVVEGVTAQWPAIITEDEWRAVVDILGNPARATYKGSRSLKWLGTNLYVCGYPGCGSLMRSAGVSSQGANGAKLAAYRCKGGLHLSVRADPVDDVVHQTARDLLTEHGSGLIEVSGTDGAAELRDRANTLRTRLAELEDMLGDEEISRAGYLRQREKFTSKLDAVSEQLAGHTSGSVFAGVADAADPGAAYDGQTIERKRAIVATLMTVTILPGKAGRPPKGASFAYDRIKIDPLVKRS